MVGSEELDYNFALLKLEMAVDFTDTVRPICLPRDPAETFEAMLGVVTGWGSADPANHTGLSQALQEAEVTVSPIKNLNLTNLCG